MSVKINGSLQSLNRKTYEKAILSGTRWLIKISFLDLDRLGLESIYEFKYEQMLNELSTHVVI